MNNYELTIILEAKTTAAKKKTVLESIEKTVKLLKEIGRNGGYIFSPAHSTPGDVPAENMAAMIEVVQNQEKYR